VLKPSNQNAKFCYEQAVEARAKKVECPKPAEHAFWRDIETYWLRLAASFD